MVGRDYCDGGEDADVEDREDDQEIASTVAPQEESADEDRDRNEVDEEPQQKVGQIDGS